MHPRVILLVLDGFGIGKDSPFNAIQNSKMPFYRTLCAHYPHSQLLTHGEAVGLPAGVMGNSEVGHMTMGAGRVLYQDLTRISRAIDDGSFFKNTVLRKTIEQAAYQTGRVHLMGLLSDGGVHSHIQHLFALLDLCLELKIPHVSIHPFLDGRDTPPQSGIRYLKQLLAHPLFASSDSTTKATIASLMGRYWAMDRDQRWDRIERAYTTLTGQQHPTAGDILSIVEQAYCDQKTDEFFEPLTLNQAHTLRNEDGVLFFNFRSDRARQLSQALTDPLFSHFDRKPRFQTSHFTGMTLYNEHLTYVQVAFQPQSIQNIFSECLEKNHLSQLRIAETEKYAHVTFFFNAGRETPFQREERILIPSVKNVATYDLKPEMSAFQIAQAAVNRIQAPSPEQAPDFILMNFANADMVGHTGNYLAAVRAMETLDQCLHLVIGAAEKNGYHVLLTSDHGNAEEMQDAHGQIHTQHTCNPVPLIWVAPGSAIAPKKSRLPLQDGTLADLMPTLCELLRLPLPPEVTGHSLLPQGGRES